MTPMLILSLTVSCCNAGAFAVILQQLNCSLGYVYEIMGVLIGSAVAPVAMCLCWPKTNKWGAIAGAFGGQWLGLISWVLCAKVSLLSRSLSGLPDIQSDF